MVHNAKGMKLRSMKAARLNNEAQNFVLFCFAARLSLPTTIVLWWDASRPFFGRSCGVSTYARVSLHGHPFVLAVFAVRSYNRAGHES